MTSRNKFNKYTKKLLNIIGGNNNIIDHLFISELDEANDLKFLEKNNIKHIITIGYNDPITVILIKNGTLYFMIINDHEMHFVIIFL